MHPTMMVKIKEIVKGIFSERETSSEGQKGIVSSVDCKNTQIFKKALSFKERLTLFGEITCRCDGSVREFLFSEFREILPRLFDKKIYPWISDHADKWTNWNQFREECCETFLLEIHKGDEIDIMKKSRQNNGEVMEVFLSRVKQKAYMLGKELSEPELVRIVYNGMLSLYRGNIHLEKCKDIARLIKYARRVESTTESLSLDHTHVGMISEKAKNHELAERDNKQFGKKTADIITLCYQRKD